MDTNSKKPRGRPKGTTPPKTSAERMRLARERIRAAILSRTVTHLTDAQVLEALAVAYRAADTPVFFECLRLLQARYQSKAIADDSDTVTGYAQAEIPEISDTVTQSERELSDTVTVNTESSKSDKLSTGAGLEPIEPPDTLLQLEPLEPTPAKPTKDYPPELKARAVAMHQQGESRDAITAMLIAAHGKAPELKE